MAGGKYLLKPSVSCDHTDCRLAVAGRLYRKHNSWLYRDNNCEDGGVEEEKVATESDSKVNTFQIEVKKKKQELKNNTKKSILDIFKDYESTETGSETTTGSKVRRHKVMRVILIMVLNYFLIPDLKYFLPEP